MKQTIIILLIFAGAFIVLSTVGCKSSMKPSYSHKVDKCPQWVVK